jgi:hypothetical protein
MSTENNRLLLELDKTIREINRRVINPEIPELSLNDLNPIMELVARARSNYLKELFDMATVVEDGMPSPDQLKQLRYLRLSFEELREGAQALEAAIQRGYLDVSRG